MTRKRISRPNVLVLGATSAIAQGVIKAFAADGARLYLVARQEAKLQAVAQDARVRGASEVITRTADFESGDQHAPVIAEVFAALKSLDYVLIAHGRLPDPGRRDSDFGEIERVFRVNLLSVISLAELLAPAMEKARSGVLGVISSVAADRGRRSSGVYGASKAALDSYLGALRGRLVRSGVGVLTIKPGFVDTPMTARFKKNALFADPDSVGRTIHRALAQRKDILYVPGYWRWIMAAVKMIPEGIFKWMKV